MIVFACWAGVLVNALLIYGLYSKIHNLERALLKANSTADRSLDLIAEIYSRPEVECEMAKEARKRRRENAALGIYPEI